MELVISDYIEFYDMRADLPHQNDNKTDNLDEGKWMDRHHLCKFMIAYQVHHKPKQGRGQQELHAERARNRPA